MTGLRAVMGSWKTMAMREPRSLRSGSTGGQGGCEREQSGSGGGSREVAGVFCGGGGQAPRHIGGSHLLIRERMDDQITHPLIALLIDRRCAVGKRLLNKLNHRGFRFELIALGI